ncbi:MAG: DNA polymerase III subunit gamma/tau [Armatimonadota bacterium]|nr:DNA polymerase III subunit gamma/tau [Armatimonadota bacterium]MDR7548368.1 DNA polymerase III subunit gamma/tau [Armatimonadota bacterium]
MSVYRRWRPQSFEEIIGQERITRTLQNAIKASRITHAYLFAGHRGTGKTTTARILAKALNCASGPTPTPDNTCPQCQAIARGTSMDVIEIDGASNTSVDDVRDLKEKIVLAPTEGRYKVYIIDEVHMLSVSAFNALLKTLEEPPAHAVFVLVTTEPHRIPATVLSRCQRFDFRRVSFREIAARLRTIAQQEGIAIDDAALAQIARSADGSVRDAESMLDQLSAYAAGAIDRTLVTEVLGLVAEDVAAAFADAVLRRDVAAALRLAQEAADAGKDIRQVLRALVEHFRDLLLVKTCGPLAAEILDAPEDHYTRLAGQVEEATVADLLRAVRVLGDASSDARWSTQPRLALEVALVRLARPEMDPTLESVLARLDRLEAAANPAPASRPAAGSSPESPAPRAAPASPPGTPPPPATPKSRPERPAEPASSLVTIDEVRRQWARVLEDIKRTKMICHALLIDGTPLEVAGDTLVVGLRSAYTFHMENLNRPENREIVEQALTKVLARPLRFRCQLFEAVPPTSGEAPAAAAGEDATPASATDGGKIEDGSPFIERARELFGARIVNERPAG